MPNTVSVINMKGGVGKSTITVELAWHCAYYEDWKVLVVDLDPQFNASQYLLGNDRYEKHLIDKRATVSDMFEHPIRLQQSGQRASALTPKSVITRVQHWEDGSRIDLVPSRLELNYSLKNPAGKERQLKCFLEQDQIADVYDLILIDCAPTDSMLTTAAYLASTEVLIPAKPEYLSCIGLPLVLRSLDDHMDLYGQDDIEILGIVVNAASEKMTSYDRAMDYIKSFAAEEGIHVFASQVPYSQSFLRAAEQGTPLFSTTYARTKKKDETSVAMQEIVARLRYATSDNEDGI